MLPDRVSNPGPLTYESGALPIALRGPAGPKPVRAIEVLQYIVYSAKLCPNIATTVRHRSNGCKRTVLPRSAFLPIEFFFIITVRIINTGIVSEVKPYF